MKVIKSWLTKIQFYILTTIIVYCLVVSLSNSAFLTLGNLFDLINTSAVTMILALGVLLVLLSGGIDISFTAITVCAAYTAVRMVQTTGIDNLIFAFMVAIVVGIVLGAINGFVIHYFKLPTFIVTLGTQILFIGLLAILVGTDSINTEQCPQCFKDFGTNKLFTITTSEGTQCGLSVSILPVILLILLTWFLINHTMIGRGIVALGNSETSAMRAGFNLFKIRMFIYIYIGVLSAVAGVISISEVAWIAPLSSGIIGMELVIIAAVVIGGASLSGGEGTIFGTILGVLLIRLFNTTLIFLGLSTSWNDFFIGLVLVICMVGTSLQVRYRKRHLLLFEE